MFSSATIVGHLGRWTIFSGYSITFFFGLYLTARYFRLYPVRILSRHGGLVYVASLAVVTTVSVVALVLVGNWARMLRYDNPLVIVGAIGLLNAFSHLRFHSRLVNSLATACFAVYIIHFDPLVFHYFAMAVKSIYNSTLGLVTVAAISMFLVAVFLACWLIDRVRLCASRFVFR